MLELACEAAALGHERRRLERLGRDSASVSSRRIDALVRIGAIEIERRRHQPPDIDIRSEKFKKLVRYFFDLAREASGETLDPEVARKFWERVEERLIGWQDQIDPLPGAGPSK